MGSDASNSHDDPDDRDDLPIEVLSPVLRAGDGEHGSESAAGRDDSDNDDDETRKPRANRSNSDVVPPIADRSGGRALQRPRTLDRVMARDLEREMEGVASIEHDILDDDGRSRKGSSSTESLAVAPTTAIPAPPTPQTVSRATRLKMKIRGSRAPNKDEDEGQDEDQDLGTLDVDLPRETGLSHSPSSTSRLETGLEQSLASAQRHVARARVALRTQPKVRRSSAVASAGKKQIRKVGPGVQRSSNARASQLEG